MTGAVHERVSEPRLGQHAPRDGVHLLGRDTRPHRRDRRLLCTLEYGILLRHFRIRLTQTIGSGAVRMISRFVGAPDVDDHDVTGLQHALRALVVWIGAVRTRPDDDERDA